MAKYDFEFKLMIVNEYINGKGGLRYLSSKHGVHHCMIQRWIANLISGNPAISGVLGALGFNLNDIYNGNSLLMDENGECVTKDSVLNSKKSVEEKVDILNGKYNTNQSLTESLNRAIDNGLLTVTNGKAAFSTGWMDESGGYDQAAYEAIGIASQMLQGALYGDNKNSAAAYDLLSAVYGLKSQSANYSIWDDVASFFGGNAGKAKSVDEFVNYLNERSGSGVGYTQGGVTLATGSGEDQGANISADNEEAKAAIEETQTEYENLKNEIEENPTKLKGDRKSCLKPQREQKTQ